MPATVMASTVSATVVAAVVTVTAAAIASATAACDFRSGFLNFKRPGLGKTETSEDHSGKK